jgi:uncharacterized protein (DUF2141 family)
LKNLKIGKLSFWAAGFLLMFSCANPITPTGGPKDIIPPKIESASPPNRSTMQQPDKIVVKFDEYIALDNPVQNITISPPLDGNPEFLQKGKSIVILLPKDSLADSTTYTIYFGASIKDNNEGNIQDSFSYVFSTGPYLDSLKFSGKVIKSESGEPEESFLVGLYSSDEDSVSFKRKPNYYGKTGKDGTFSIENLKTGVYRVVAFKDENNSYTKDQPSERTAFLKMPAIVADSNNNSVILKSFPENLKLRLLEFNNKIPGQIQFILSNRADTFSIESYSGKEILESHYQIINRTRDTILIFHGFNTAVFDSFKVLINGSITDTIFLNFKTINKDSIRMLMSPLGIYDGTAPKKKGVVTTNAAPTGIDYFSPLTIKWNRPVVVSRGTDSITAVFDTLRTPVNINVNIIDGFTWNIYPKSGYWEQGKNYEINIPDSVIHDYFNIYNEEITLKFTATKKEGYGHISIRIDSLNTDKQYIIHILNSGGAAIKEEVISHKSSVLFTYKQFMPGNYRLKIIEDENFNGRWDTGDLIQKIQPETIIYFPENIEVRAKWENEIQFSLKPPAGNNKSEKTK